MHLRTLFATVLATLASMAVADMTTVTDFVTVTPSAAQSLQATSTPSTCTTITTSSTALSTQAPVSPSSGGADSVDTNAGAAGSSGGDTFSISKGGMIAIIVVVSLVAALGSKFPTSAPWAIVGCETDCATVASAALFFIAKRRQWNVRASIARASRRLTGRPVPRSTPGRGGDRRTGMYAGGPPRLQGYHKRGLVADERKMERKDVEKGTLKALPGMSTEGKKSGWKERIMGNDWK